MPYSRILPSCAFQMQVTISKIPCSEFQDRVIYGFLDASEASACVAQETIGKRRWYGRHWPAKRWCWWRSGKEKRGGQNRKRTSKTIEEVTGESAHFGPCMLHLCRCSCTQAWKCVSRNISNLTTSVFFELCVWVALTSQQQLSGGLFFKFRLCELQTSGYILQNVHWERNIYW